jgi:Raf kinase inhibitor-like YbhB/YbcL family protein
VSLPALIAVAFALSSPAFAAGHAIPRQYTCDGGGRSPALRWTASPRGTRSLALEVVDPDAPSGTFTHWLAWGIKPSVRRLAAGAHPLRQGRNSAGTIGYTPPCPPPGPAHHYRFTLYALGTHLDLPNRAKLDQALQAIAKAARAQGRLTGTFAR